MVHLYLLLDKPEFLYKLGKDLKFRTLKIVEAALIDADALDRHKIKVLNISIGGFNHNLYVRENSTESQNVLCSIPILGPHFTYTKPHPQIPHWSAGDAVPAHIRDLNITIHGHDGQKISETYWGSSSLMLSIIIE